AGKAASNTELLPTARIATSEIGASGRAWFLTISRPTTRRRKDGPASSSYDASPTSSERHSQCVFVNNFVSNNGYFSLFSTNRCLIRKSLSRLIASSEAGSQSPSHIVVGRGAERKSENFKGRAVVQLK